jgi:hypothetical protein
MFRFAEKLNVQPVLKGQALVTDGTLQTAYTHLDQVNWLTYVVPFGDFGTTVAADKVTFTVECSTVAGSNATEVQVPFRYRLTGVPTANTIGAIGTAVATDGYAVTGTANNGAILLIDVDPAEAYAAHAQADSAFVRLVMVAAGADGDLTSVSVHAVVEPRYPGNTHVSVT